jgi:hypoxanthine-DNA glycosylase
MQILHCFPPVINKKSKILILGSMPGVKSLKAQQYYGNPLNQFWLIMEDVLDCQFSTNYLEKLETLLRNDVALWDSIGSCTREGSLDSQIKNANVNNVEGLIKEYKNIKAVFCNGQTSFNLFEKNHSRFPLPSHPLPSSSPAFTKPLKWKISQWKKIISPYL